MNNEVSATQTSSTEKRFTLKLLLVVAIAFVTALLFRRSAGIVAMTPLAFGICFAAAFIDIKFYLKAFVFGISVFSINSIEQSDISVPIIFSALCLLTLAAFEFSVSYFKKNKKAGIILSSASALVCIAFSFVFIGNPISAIFANQKFEKHIEKTYSNDKNDIFGTFEFSNIYYDFSTKAYTIDARSSKYPTLNSTVTMSKNIITDKFHSQMESIITEPYILEMTGILRQAFPSDNFSVECDELISLPDENTLSASEKSLYGNIVYEITLGGVQSYDTMQSKVMKYMEAIEASDIGYARINFKSGSGEWYRRSVTIDNDYSVSNPSFNVSLVLKGSSNRFNSLLSHRLNKDNTTDYVNHYLSDRRGICYAHTGVYCFCFNKGAAE